MKVVKQYYVAKYLRISKEDEGKEQDNSESIENQERLIDQFLSKHPEMQIYDTYIDDGFSGLYYDRKEYQRMMADVDAGHVNVIICKSLSRLGRDLATTINLLQREFLIKNIRFIAITDNVDTGINQDNGLDIPIRAMFNDYYCRNLSANVRAAFDVKRHNGLYIGAFACYGYQKDPENHNRLIVDSEAAEVVKRIYQLYIEGVGTQGICKILNSEGVPCPSEYKRLKGYSYRNTKKLRTTVYWTFSTVAYILKNEMYCGHLVQGKTQMVAYNIKKARYKDYNEWIRIENTHEAIIKQEDYDRVQKMFSLYNKNQIPGATSVYAGVFFCGDCGRAMGKQKRKEGLTFRCNTHARAGKEFCSYHYIKKDTVDQKVLETIKSNALKALSDLDMEKIKEISQKQQEKSNQDKMYYIDTRLRELEEERKIMLQNLSKKIICEQDFLVYNEMYRDELNELTKKKLSIESMEYKKNELEEAYQLWINQFIQYKDIKEITRQIVVNLIERIEYYEDGTLKIKFLFKNPYDIEAYVREISLIDCICLI